MGAPLPPDEAERLNALRSYYILDTQPEPAFDRLTDLAAQLFETSIAVLTFVDERRTWFKSRRGLSMTEMDRAKSICPYALLSDEIMVVEDLAADPRFASSELVAGPPGLRCYAGAPLKTPGGYRLGTLCVMDTRPRAAWPAERLALLAELAAVAVDELELRRAARVAEEAERARRDSEDLLASIFGAAAIGITVTDESGRFVAVNEAYCRMVGYGAGELVGQSFTIVVPDEMQAEAQRRHAAFLEGEQGGISEWQLRRKDCSLIHIHLTAARLVRADGRRFRVTTLSDVTALKRLEERARALQKMEVVAQLAGGSAHTFNNLLTVITGYSQLLRAELPPGSVLHGYADEIFQASERAAVMTTKLLTFSQRRPSQVQPVDLNSVVRQLRPALQGVLGATIELSTEFEAGLPPVMADPAHIEQVIRIVATNAREAMPEGGLLSVRTRTCHEPKADLPAGCYALLEIRDNGPGMDPQAKKHLFEPFFSTKGIGKGTGLATAYGIVRQCGGHVLVSSEPDQGTAVAVYLPLAAGGQ